MHYSKTFEELTAKEIVDGWHYHGDQPPVMYAILNSADWFALACWTYLEGRKELMHRIGIKKFPTPEEYTQTIEELDKREHAMRLLKEVIELIDNE